MPAGSGGKFISNSDSLKQNTKKNQTKQTLISFSNDILTVRFCRRKQPLLKIQAFRQLSLPQQIQSSGRQAKRSSSGGIL